MLTAAQKIVVLFGNRLANAILNAFRNSEPGLHYEVPTLAQNAVQPTVFTDATGLTPVTALESAAGLQLDTKYGAGYRGAELRSTGAVALLGSATAATYNTGTGAGSVTRVDASNQSYVTVAGFGSNGWAELTITNTAATSLLIRSASVAGTTLYTLTTGATATNLKVQASTDGTLYFTANSAATVTFTLSSIRSLPGNHASQSSAGARPTYTARVNLLLATATLSTQSVTVVAASHKLSFTGTGTVTLSGVSTAGPLVGTGASDRVSLTFTPTAGSLTLTVTGSVTLADLRNADNVAKSIPVYQEVTSASVYDAIGFPHRIVGNGTSHFMTATLDMSGTDKVAVVAGVTKNSDSAAGMICELTASTAANNGGFLLLASGIYSGGDRLTYAAETRGTTSALSREMRPFTAPHSGVVSTQGDNGAGTLTGRVNGATPSGGNANSTAAGNYANSTLYLFSRAGSSVFLNGGFSSLTIRGGSITTNLLSALESYAKRLAKLVY